MKTTYWFFSLLLATLATVGCGPTLEGPREPGDPPPVQEASVRLLRVIAINRSTVRVAWDPPEKTHETQYPVAYRVRWEPLEGTATRVSDTGSAFIGDYISPSRTEIDIDRLQDKMYRFTVEVVVKTGEFSYATEPGKAAADGSPAERYSSDAARPGNPIRIYESASGQGNGLILDPFGSGPTRVIPENVLPEQLALVLQVDGDIPSGYVRLAAAHTVPEYRSANLTDTTIYLNNATPSPLSLDYWSVHTSQYRFTGALRDRTYFVDIEQTLSSAAAYYNFTLSTGERGAENHRYARISVVADANHAILHGTAPNRYIEVVVSIGYAGLEFA